MKNRWKLYSHGLLLLLSLVIPLFFMLLRLNIGNGLYTMLFLNSPFIFWLLISPLKGRFLDIEEMDLYAGISSKLMFLTMAIPNIGAVFPHHPIYNVGETYFWYIFSGSGYAYTLPYEYFIIFIPVLIYGFATRNWNMLGGQTGPLLLVLSNLGILSLYLILLYWKKKYRITVAKILFTSSIIIQTIILFLISATPLVYNSLTQLLYLALNAYRLSEVRGK